MAPHTAHSAPCAVGQPTAALLRAARCSTPTPPSRPFGSGRASPPPAPGSSQQWPCSAPGTASSSCAGGGPRDVSCMPCCAQTAARRGVARGCLLPQALPPLVGAYLGLKPCLAVTAFSQGLPYSFSMATLCGAMIALPAAACLRAPAVWWVVGPEGVGGCRQGEGCRGAVRCDHVALSGSSCASRSAPARRRARARADAPRRVRDPDHLPA